MQPIVQNDFSGGMSAMPTSVKTPANSIRCLLNGRLRRNSIAGSFAPIRIASPNRVHQCIFAADDDILVMISGELHNLDNLETLVKVQNFPVMSLTADTVWHENVPAPTNFLQGLGDTQEYNSTISTTPECTVLQDNISQPLIYSSQGAGRAAKTYAEWTFAAPEYVPVGNKMCYSGNVLYVSSPNSKLIYRSVAGRPLDFVINVNNAGKKTGDASTTAIAFAAAPLTALITGQGGGILGFTKGRAYAGVPDTSRRLIFDQIQVVPQELFPVGAVGQQAFTFARGQSVFISPQGIQQFNQVMQLDNASNNSPFGAEINDFIVRPIVNAATCTADDYTFFGLDTIYGAGILIYDNILEKFVSIDLVGSVKEFATVVRDGMTRVFFITTTNELYEIPLYRGSRKAYSVYFGEKVAGAPGTKVQILKLLIGFNDVRAAGNVTAVLYADKELVDEQTKVLTCEAPLSSVPVAFPYDGPRTAAALEFTFTNPPAAYAAGLVVHCAADAEIVSAEIALNAPTSSIESVSDVSDTYIAFGDIGSDNNYYGACVASVEQGQPHVFLTPYTAGELMNGGERIKVSANHPAKVFITAADRIYFDEENQVFQYSTLKTLLQETDAVPILLGDLGYSKYYDGIAEMIRYCGFDPQGLLSVAGDNDRISEEQYAKFNGTFGRPRIQKIAHRHANFFLLQNPEDDDYNFVNANTDDNKFNIVCFHASPYNSSSTGQDVSLRWNFKKAGVQMVLSANSNSYQQTYVNGVYYFAVGTGNPRGLSSNPDGISVCGRLRMSISAAHINAAFIDAAGSIRDIAFISR